jgi:hypothetical protein
MPAPPGAGSAAQAGVAACASSMQASRWRRFCATLAGAGTALREGFID